MKGVSCALMALFILFAPRDVNSAVSDPREAAILTTMAEAAVASVSLVRDLTDGGAEFSWIADYSEREWFFEAEGIVDGRKVNFSMSGYLWGQDEEDWLIGYSGLGSLEDAEIRIHGQADWHYDKEVPYQDVDFRHVMRFGANSVWGWVIGAETIFGGTIGAGAAIATAAAGTGGVALGLAPWIAASGALAGSGAMIGVSAATKDLLESDEPAPPPPAPERPPPPNAGEQLLPSEGTILTAISHNGEMFASGPDGTHVLVGNFKSDGVQGSAEGVIAAR